MADPHASLNDVQNQSAEKARAHAETIIERPPGRTIWVAATDPGNPVRNGALTIAETAVEVSADDVFIARRIRDGSLRTAEPLKAPAAPQANTANLAADNRPDRGDPTMESRR